MLVRWNLFSDWRDETLEEQKRIYNELGFESFEECRLEDTVAEKQEVL